MTTFSKDAVIVAQNATQPAATIVAALIASGTIEPSVESAIEAFTEIRGAIFDGAFSLATDEAALEMTSNEPARSSGGRGGSRNYRPRNGGGGNGAPQNPGTVDFRGGKYNGKTIADVYEDDPSYLDWCVGNLKNEFMVGRIEEFLASVN